jgi:hypothetical protein
MIEPTAPALDVSSSKSGDNAGDADGLPYFEPSLKIVSADDSDASRIAEGRNGVPHLAMRGTRDRDEGAKPIHLEVHNTSADRDIHATGRKSRDAADAAAGGTSSADKDGGDRTARDSRKAAGRRAGGSDADGGASPRDAGEANDEVKLKGALLRTVAFRETSLAKIDEESVSNPAFNIFANARMWRHDERNLNYSGEVAKRYRDVFPPTRPKKDYRDFSGRRDTIEAIIQAVEEERSHVILLGEKSLGKTSLMNIIAECAKEAGYLVARMTGTADLTFEHFIFAILEQFSARIAETPVKDILQKRMGTEDLCQLVDRKRELDVPAAIKIFQRLTEHQAIVLVDDFERIENAELKTRIGELMGVLSDQGAWLSLLLFGRASRAGDILPESFQSLPNVTWIKLQPMSDEDSARVIARGVSAVGVQFGDEVTESIMRLSQGMPSAIQWLCLLAIRRATQRYASEVEMHDLADVVPTAIGKIDAKLSAFYDQVCGPTRGSWADDVLYLAVQTPADSNGVFSTEIMSRISFDILGRSTLELPLHSALSRLIGEDGKPILEKIWTSSGTCYRFLNPAMRAIVMLKNCGRLPHMPDTLLEGAHEMELLPSPGAAPGVA